MARLVLQLLTPFLNCPALVFYVSDLFKPRVRPTTSPPSPIKKELLPSSDIIERNNHHNMHLLYTKGVAGPRHFLEWEQYVWPFRQEGDAWTESEGEVCVTVERGC
ncbi:unnamed protein product [Tetraodon nigroviridis]|uniref:(spotted green pufferfish) hypothetical protein n=1 Tax=Tetraodon nigroviridis TaxID=99883 RepID=Q4RL12_TETNG|nr:unnamed protein product [Tetraodon nigroviridis]